VISLIALFLALGGTSFAASKVILAKHKDAKADTKLVKKLAPKLSVKHAKTADSATNATNATHATSADSATNATNATNATHATSATSATNATNATTAGNANALGGHGASYFATATLHAGQSESGDWIVAGGSSSTGFGGDGISYHIPLASALDGSHVDYVGTGTDTNCPGAGHAAAGFLCIYATLDEGMTVGPFNSAGFTGSDSYGFFMGAELTANPALAYGSWTVTAAANAVAPATAPKSRSRFGAGGR
jgi:hypothetical protein